MSMVREERTIEVTLISATDLKKVKRLGREQKCYVAAYVYPARKQITPADLYGGVNPTWNTTLKLTCYETDLHPATTNGSPAASTSSSPSSQVLTVEIYSHGGGMFHSSDKLVGTVIVPLQDVASAAKVGGDMSAFQVHLPSGEVHGLLNLSVKLGAKRELGEYEDLTAAVLPSYSSNQETPSWSYPPANDKAHSTQPRSSYTSMGQSSYDSRPPARSDPTMTPAQPNKTTFPEEEDDVVTGYPAPAYAFAPLGQLPMQRQEEQRPEPGTHGPYVVHSPDRRGRGRRGRRRREGGRRRRGPIHLGIMVIQGIFTPIALGIRGHLSQSGAQHETDVSSSSSSQQTSNYGPGQQTSTYGPSQQTSNYGPSQQTSNYGPTKHHP